MPSFQDGEGEDVLASTQIEEDEEEEEEEEMIVGPALESKEKVELDLEDLEMLIDTR